MAVITTVDLVRTERGGIFDVCLGDDGLFHVRVNDGSKNEAVMVMQQDEVENLRDALSEALK